MITERLDDQDAPRKHLARDLIKALNHGLFVWLLADTAQGYHQLERAIEVAFPGWSQKIPTEIRPRVQIKSALYDIAETIARHDPGPPANSQLGIPDVAFESAEARLLLSRAFWDCESIQLVPLEGGRSASVFEVHASAPLSTTRSFALPFFAKFDSPGAIWKERENYREFGSQVPFRLRPNIDERRCIIGPTTALLVGGFVEGSEPLSHVLRSGKGLEALGSVFQEALKGWHGEAREKGPQRQRLLEFLTFPEDPPPSSRLDRAKRLGLQRDPARIRTKLVEFEVEHLRGPAHCDLHGRNVCVVGSSGIIIDFYAACIAGILADPASFEVDLAFDSLGSQDSAQLAAWKTEVDHLFKPRPFMDLRGSRKPEPALSWLRGAVRELRRLTRPLHTDEKEYQVMLAHYLLRQGTYPADAEEGDEDRRAFALVLAERLMESAVR